jgi:hypothetical protein
MERNISYTTFAMSAILDLATGLYVRRNKARVSGAMFAAEL